LKKLSAQSLHQLRDASSRAQPSQPRWDLESR